jgi:peptidoglycan/LPS O-acetylase OafA/YrhL
MDAARNPLGRNNFDFLRFALASLVILSHSWPLGTGTHEGEPLYMATGGQLTMGQFAVYGFFIISGFLITHSWFSKPRIVPYLKKRAARIYPGFVVAALVSALVAAPLCSNAGYPGLHLGSVTRAMANMVRLRLETPVEAFASNPYPQAVNGSLWSIPYEFRCYLGVLTLGLCGLLPRRWVLLACLGLSIACAMLYSCVSMPEGAKVVTALIGRPYYAATLAPYFLVGMAFYVCRERISLRGSWAVVSLVALAIAARVPHGMVLALPLAGAYLIFYAAFLPLGGLERWGKHGDFSYGIYLYAFPIQQCIVHVYGAAVAPWGLFLMAWPPSVVAGALSWHLVEKHWLTRRRMTATPAKPEPELVASSAA